MLYMNMILFIYIDVLYWPKGWAKLAKIGLFLMCKFVKIQWQRRGRQQIMYKVSQIMLDRQWVYITISGNYQKI